MQNSLNLVGDGDDLDLIRDVEQQFGIVIAGDEAEKLRNVGQLHDLIEAKCGGSGRADACFSQIAFYRLRRAFVAAGVRSVKPTTPISVLRDLPGKSIAQQWKALGRCAGLQLPQLEIPFSLLKPVSWQALSVWVFAGVAVMTAAWLASRLGVTLVEFLGNAFICGPLIIIVAHLALYRLFENVPHRIASVGDLAREAAACSFAKLAATKPTPSRADRWDALVAVLRGVSGHTSDISRETTFLARQS